MNKIKYKSYDETAEEIKKQRYDKTETARQEKATRKKINPYASEKIELNSRIMKRLQKEFNNRLIVIDEIHNIRKTDDNENTFPAKRKWPTSDLNLSTRLKIIYPSLHRSCW